MNICIKCKAEPRRAITARWCKGCHNEDMRAWRKRTGYKKPRTERTKIRDLHRTWVRRGKIVKIDTCLTCGCGPTQMHHIRYETDPSSLVWLCQSCHVKTHTNKLSLLIDR